MHLPVFSWHGLTEVDSELLKVGGHHVYTSQTIAQYLTPSAEVGVLYVWAGYWTSSIAGMAGCHNLLHESVVVGRCGGPVGPLLQDSLVNFFPVHLYFRRRLDTNTNLVPFNSEYGDNDVIIDDKLLSNPSCQYKHNNLPLVSDTSCIRAFIVFYAYAKTIRETIKNNAQPSMAAIALFPSFFATVVSCFRQPIAALNSAPHPVLPAGNRRLGQNRDVLRPCRRLVVRRSLPDCRPESE